MLRKDKEEVEAIKHAKALEAEKAMYSVSQHPLRTSCLLCDWYIEDFLSDMFDHLRAGAPADKGESLERRD